MRNSLLSVSAIALGLAVAGSAPAAAGPIGLMPGPGSIAVASATSSVTGPELDRMVFLLNGGSGPSGVWPGGGGASICLGCFVENWNAGGNPFGFGPAPAGTGGNGGPGGFSGQISLPSLPATLPAAPATSFTLPFLILGTLHGFNVFGQGELLFSAGGGLATGAPRPSSEAPEPGSLLLVSTGVPALVLAARRRWRKARG